ncbi:MAG TPA: 16S rRNA (cytosine(967)-C(5))-methyltransferase RsmB [Erysipelotrichaceae bacterium]|nr:16S rRNA (cytosine(967)-C(5))-methyltransferase RsmB [Erysipelotrichaceae bacterium]
MKARQLAYEILFDVIVRQQYASLALKQRLQEAPVIDQTLCTSIVYTCLQNHRYIRVLWQRHTTYYPSSKIAVLLDSATTQLIFFDRVPDYAILNETVELAKNIDINSAKMVNAVLHKVLEKGKEKLVGLDELDTIALNASLPTFVVKLWSKHYGMEQTLLNAQALLEPSLLCGRVNPLKIDPDEIFYDPNVTRGKLSEYAFYSKDNIVQSDWFKNGECWLQDEASQLVSEFLEPMDNLNVLDACSAPGTKTAATAVLMHNTGHIDAIELHETRTGLIDKQLVHLGITNVTTYTMDARDAKDNFKHKYYDRILVDVPCSGLGVLRRKADIKLRVTPAQLDELQALQASILEGVYECLKIDGIMVYSTCTLNRKENEMQIKNFVEKHPEFKLLEERTIFPNEYHTDGFYMAKLKRFA